MARQKYRPPTSPWVFAQLCGTIALGVIVGLILTPVLYDLAH